MPITSIGYDGTVDEAGWAKLMGLAGSKYTVASATDYATTAVGGARAVSTAAGSAYGQGVLAINSAPVQTNLKTPAAGQFFLIALHRDWATNTSTIVAIDGATTSNVAPTTPPSILPAAVDSAPGVKDDQPLYWAWVNNSSTAVTLFDLRKFPIESRLSALENRKSRGTSAERDAYWGFPATSADRVALAANAGPWFNTELGYHERYYASSATDSGTAGYSTYNARPTAGWKPEAPGLIPITPGSVQAVGGVATVVGNTIKFTNVSTLNIDSLFTDAFDHYRFELNVNHSVAGLTTLNFRAGLSTLQAAASYLRQVSTYAGGTVTGSAQNGTLTYLSAFSSAGWFGNCEIYYPTSAVQTTLYDNQSARSDQHGRITGNTSFSTPVDGMSLANSGGGVIAGQIRCYAYGGGN